MGNHRRRVMVKKTLRVLVQFVTCRGCGCEEECPAETLENTWPGKRHMVLADEEIPEGTEFVVREDRMPVGWSALSSHTEPHAGTFSLGSDRCLVSEEGMKLRGMGVYFCRDCTPKIKVSHPYLEDKRDEPKDED